MSAKKEVSKQTSVIIIAIAVLVIVVFGYLLFFRKEKVQPVAGKAQEFMPTEMQQKLEQMGASKGVLAGKEPATP